MLVHKKRWLDPYLIPQDKDQINRFIDSHDQAHDEAKKGLSGDDEKEFSDSVYRKTTNV
jgi:hypothetical protein